MKLFLVRHAHALDGAENPERPLSANGRADTAKLAAFFRANRAFTKAVIIWHSPLLRSRETAELLSPAFHADAHLVETPGLEPGDNPADTADRLVGLSTDLVIVGHEPHLGALAVQLVRGKPGTNLWNLRKGAVIALEPENKIRKKTGRRRWRVSWHFSPELLPSSA